MSAPFQSSQFQFPNLALASSSPRRRELLKQLGLPFKVVAPRIEERRRKGEPPRHFARRLATDKARDVASRLRGREIVVAADTIVVLGKHVLGKPKNAADARRMLRLLSGRRHKVISGLCVMSRAKATSLVVATNVEFKRLTLEEIEFYIASGEPMDKAGAYAIQGIGGFMIRAIHGSYTNVVGLPVAELLDALENDFGFKLWMEGKKRLSRAKRARIASSNEAGDQKMRKAHRAPPRDGATKTARRSARTT